MNVLKLRSADLEAADADNATVADPQRQLDLYKRAFDKIQTVCHRAGNGDLEARIIEIEGFDDIRPVFESINHMLDLTDAFVRESGASLKSANEKRYYREFLTRGMLGDFGRGAGLINGARETMERMEAETAEIRNRLADEFDSTVAEVVRAVAAAAERLSSSAAVMVEEAETMHQQCVTVASAAEVANENTYTVAVGSQELTSSILEISRQVNESTHATQRVVDQVQRTNEAVGELTDAASKVDTVVDFIREIAGQTNLLALNATIEAARAGDAGKGFAVVAHEVKSLAKQSADATQDIEVQINTIKDASGLTSEAVGRIGGEADQVSEFSTAVASAIEEQTAATDEISNSVQRAAEGIEGAAQGITSIEDASRRTGSAAKDVLDAAGELSRHSATLDQEVAKFLREIRST